MAISSTTIIRRAGAVFILCFVAALFVPSAQAHKFHASFTEIERNPETKNLEVTIRVFPDDLENILGKREKKRIQIDAVEDAPRVVGDYVREHLVVRGPDGKNIQWKWVGMEVKVDAVWIYVESPSPPSLDKWQVRDSLFFDLFDDQINSVTVRDGTRRGSIQFRGKDAFKPIFPSPTKSRRR